MPARRSCAPPRAGPPCYTGADEPEGRTLRVPSWRSQAVDDETMSRFTFSTIIRRAGAALAAAPAASPLARWRHLLDVRRGALLAAGVSVRRLNGGFPSVRLASAAGWGPQSAS